MKISRLFHWLYAILMLLPFVPVVSFGLYYAFNKNAVVPEVTKYESKEVDFNQLLPIKGTQTINGISITSNHDGSYILNGTATSNVYAYWNNLYNLQGHKILFYLVNSAIEGVSLRDGNYGTEYAITESIYNNTNRATINVDLFVLSGTTVNNARVIPMAFDLSKIFGAGNEPTIEEFNAWFPEDYYEYTESKHIVIPNYREITEIDSAINHIWLPSFGGMGWTIKNIFTFLITTIFGISVIGGIGEVILYLLTYWLCISLIWLIYDVIMYVPLMIHRWLDKGVID